MGHFFNFDIDKETPQQIIDRVNNKNDRLFNTRYVNPHKLFDWRKLEKRYNEFSNIYTFYYAQYWSLVRSFKEAGIANGASETWIPISKNPQSLYVLNHDKIGSLSLRTIQDVYDRFTKTQNKHGYRPGANDLLEFERLDERKNAWARRATAYRRAFRQAVEARLTTMFTLQTSYDGTGYFVGNILVQNDDRVYLVSYKNYQIVWDETSIFQTPTTSNIDTTLMSTCGPREPHDILVVK